jgi:nicotinic acid mononucleotide adenylyltransferase
MINSEYYRLAEFKIIESKDGFIWWETHSGFCSVKMGRCFVSGKILFIESGHTSEDNGFLKGEFLDELNRFPKWQKTNYYCTSFNIVNCKADQKIKFPSANYKFPKPTTQEDVSFRLGQFEIIEKRDCKLLWKSYSGRADMKVGKAFVDGNILFLGRGEAEKTGIIKKDFLERLSMLPAWEKTDYFCQHYTLYSCETNTACNELNENILSNKSENDTVVFRNKFPQIKSNIKPQPASGTTTQNYLKTFWSLFSILVFLILKVSFWFIGIIFNGLKLFIEVCALGGKRLLKRVFKLLN